MIRPITLLLLANALSACKPAVVSTAPTSPAAEAGDESLDGRPVVPNHEAKPGDVTACPYSGRKFVVQADSPRLEYQGRSYVLCSEKARDAVAADPAKYIAPDAAAQ